MVRPFNHAGPRQSPTYVLAAWRSRWPRWRPAGRLASRSATSRSSATSPTSATSSAATACWPGTARPARSTTSARAGARSSPTPWSSSGPGPPAGRGPGRPRPGAARRPAAPRRRREQAPRRHRLGAATPHRADPRRHARALPQGTRRVEAGPASRSHQDNPQRELRERDDVHRSPPQGKWTPRKSVHPIILSRRGSTRNNSPGQD